MPGKFTNLSAKQFLEHCNNPNVVLLDVRTSAEFASSHLPCAINIDIKQPDFLEEITELNPNKTYLVYCSLGIRSANACMAMSQMGFFHLYNLKGGLEAVALL